MKAQFRDMEEGLGPQKRDDEVPRISNSRKLSYCSGLKNKG
jgi:hypothetical protein